MIKVANVNRGVPRVIAVMDDEESLRRAVCRRLRKHHYTAIEIAAPEELLERVQRGDHTDLVISDVHMGLVNGFTFADELRQHAPALKVLFMSGSVMVGPNGESVLAKPFSEQQLLEAIAELLD